MKQCELNIIEETIKKQPDTFRMTNLCLQQRQELIDEIELMGQSHDSLISEYHYNFAGALENCEIMLERAFKTESDKIVAAVR